MIHKKNSWTLINGYAFKMSLALLCILFVKTIYLVSFYFIRYRVVNRPKTKERGSRAMKKCIKQKYTKALLFFRRNNMDLPCSQTNIDLNQNACQITKRRCFSVVFTFNEYMLLRLCIFTFFETRYEWERFRLKWFKSGTSSFAGEKHNSIYIMNGTK